MGPQSNEDKLDVIIKQLIAAYPDVCAIYLYGSYGTPFQNADSDIDIAFAGEKAVDSVLLWELAQTISTEVNHDVQLVDLRSASTVFRNEVITSGKRIYTGEESKCAALENLYLTMYLRFNEERREILEDRYG